MIYFLFGLSDFSDYLHQLLFADQIKLTSINIRGFGDGAKTHSIFSYLEKQATDIWLLEETSNKRIEFESADIQMERS